MSGPERARKPLLDAANAAFVALLALLPWMKLGLTVGGMEAFPADLLFLVAATLWLLARAAGQTRLRVDRAFVLLALYFAAMAVSAILSVDRSASALKLLTQVYLLLLPVLAFNLVRTDADLRRAFAWWLVPAIAVGVYGVATVALFPIFGWHSFLREPLHHFGTLPPGPYPRIELTFEFPAMLANYLGVSLMMLMLARSRGWIGGRFAIAGAAALLISAFFALTPGFGGIVAMLALWLWHAERGRRPLLASIALAAAVATIVLEVAVSAIAPVIGPTAPFLIHVPGIATPLAPAVRLLAWIAAARNFVASPLFGHGIGVDAVSVLFQTPEDTAPAYITDAHNAFLSIAAQCGLLGLAALVAIIAFAVRKARAAAAAGPSNPLVFGLWLAWLSGFAIEGLVGSFEDARHLWILFGLILSASRVETAPRPSTQANFRPHRR